MSSQFRFQGISWPFESATAFLVEYLSSLDERGRFVFFVGVPVLIFLLYVIFIYFPIKSMTNHFLEKETAIQEQAKKMKPTLRELVTLRNQLSIVLWRASNGKRLDLTTYMKSQVEKAGVNLKNLKVSTGESSNGIEVKRISVYFGETPLNGVTSLIYNVERSSYCFRCTGIKISDMDEDGLVSGSVTFNFYRRVK